jgi:hypothetical protein
MRVYLNGFLESQTTSIGTMATTNIDLTIGQMVPGNTEWNFDGVIDDVQIYNRVLSDDQIASNAGLVTSSEETPDGLPAGPVLGSVYPNPFHSSTTIPYSLHRQTRVAVVVLDLVGRPVRRLAVGEQGAGDHRLAWDGLDVTGRPVANGVYFVRLETDYGVRYREVVRVGK